MPACPILQRRMGNYIFESDNSCSCLIYQAQTKICMVGALPLKGSNLLRYFIPLSLEGRRLDSGEERVGACPEPVEGPVLSSPNGRSWFDKLTTNGIASLS